MLISSHTTTRKIFAIFFVLAGFLFSQNMALAAHTLDTSQQNNTLTASPATFTYTSGTGTTVLVLNLVVIGSTARTGGTPTYNGVAMIQANSTRIATETNTEMWYLYESTDRICLHDVHPQHQYEDNSCFYGHRKGTERLYLGS